MITIEIDIDKYNISQVIEESVIEYAKDHLVQTIEKEGWPHVVKQQMSSFRDEEIRKRITHEVERQIAEVPFEAMVRDAAMKYIDAAIPGKVKQQLDEFIERKAREVWS